MPSWKLTEHKKEGKERRRGYARTSATAPLTNLWNSLFFYTFQTEEDNQNSLSCATPPSAAASWICIAIPPRWPVWFPSCHHLGQMAVVACASTLLPPRYINQPYHQQPRRGEGGWSAATAILGAFTSQRGSTRGEEASRTGAPSWDGVNTALNVVFLYYTRSYTVLCAHFSLIILNILWTRR